MATFGLIDCQWLLARNYFAIRGPEHNPLPEYADRWIVSSVIQSLAKIVRELEEPIDKLTLLWDTYPYHKHSILEGDYKSGRDYTTDEDVEEEEDPEAKALLEIKANNLKIRGRAKWALKELGDIGIPSMYKRGYEADDLAYMVSREMLNREDNALLISIDSDWPFFCNERTRVYNPNRKVFHDEAKVRYDNNIPDDMSLYEYKSLYDSMYGSHNGLWQSCSDEHWNTPVREFMKLYKELGVVDELFKDKEMFERQLMSFDVLSYPELNKVSGMMYYLDKNGSLLSPGQLEGFFTKNLYEVNSTSIYNMLEKFDKKLFYE